MFKIERKDLTGNLESLIKKGHLILIGDPGSGKTWLINKVASKIQEENIPCIIIRADSIKVDSLSDFKTALGINNPLEEIFNYISGGKRSILFIDALDAARSEVKQSIYRQLINLIQLKCKNWFILASIRTYDVKHSQELLSLFPSGITDVPVNFRIPEIRFRHLYVPLLLEDEIYEVIDQIPPLKSVYENASVYYKELFKVPFNLWLIDQLVRDGISINELSNIQTAVQLFGLYWEYRVMKKDDSEDREHILQKATTIMVQKNELSIDKREIYIQKLSNAYKGLLSDQLLIPASTSEQRISFGHNILFDYAVSRLLIKEVPSESFKFLAKDLSRPIFLRPSVNYFFSRIWYSDRNLFWDIFWYFQYRSEEEYLRLPPMFCLINEIRTLEDFQPVLEKIRNNSLPKNQLHLLVLKRIFQTFKSIKKEIVPEKDELWIEILFQLKSFLNVEFIDEYIRLLAGAIVKLTDWQENNRKKLSVIARTILQWAWEPPKELNNLQIQRLNEVIAAWVVPLVCKTYSENPKESREILSRILNRLGPTSTTSEIYRLVHGIDNIWPHDPDFVVLIYEYVFRYQEISDEKTFLGGYILTLTSTRRQDYSMCYFSLAENFPKFLNACPLFAVKAMVKAIDAIVRREELKDIASLKYLTFQFYEIDSKFLADGSYIWDEGNSDGERKKILSSFDDYIFELSKNSSSNELLINIIRQVAGINEVAVIWRHLLETARRNPSIFIQILYPLLIAKPILVSLETNYEVGELLKIGFDYLTTEQRINIEKAILEITKDLKDVNLTVNFRKKMNTLLACIPKKYLHEEESKKIIAKLEKDKTIPENVKSFSMGKFTSRSYTEKERLEEEGVDISNINNSELLELSTPVKEFRERFFNKIPELKDCEIIFPKMIKLKETLEDSSKKYHRLLVESSLTDLVSACETVARNNKIPITHNILKFIEEVFQKAAKNPSPEYDEKYHLEFDHPSWSPSPRIEAAQGFMHLLIRDEFATETNIKLVKELAYDKVPGVRFQIIHNLAALYKTMPNEMWSIAENIAKNENTNGVLAALANSISRLARIETEKVLDIFEIISERQPIKEREHLTLFDPCLSTITSLSIIQNNKRANKLIKRYLEKPLTYPKEIREIVLSAKNYLLIGITIEWQEEPEVVRKRAKEILAKTLESAKKGFQELKNSYGDKWPEDRQNITKEIYEIVDSVGTWLYLMAEKNEDNRKQGKIVLNDSQKEKYYFEIKSLIKQVITVGRESLLHASTAHNLMELCNGVLKFDPPGVIEIAKELCAVSASYGYTLDPMAVSEVIKLVQCCIADYKEIFQDKKNLKNLTDLLNIFVQAGWPEAIQLVSNLDEIWK